MTEHEVELLHIQSGNWLVNEADRLIKQYKACKTAHERWMLLPQINEMADRITFENKEIEKLQK